MGTYVDLYNQQQSNCVSSSERRHCKTLLSLRWTHRTSPRRWTPLSRISPIITQRRPAYKNDSFPFVTKGAEIEQPVGAPFYQWVGCRDHAGITCFPHSYYQIHLNYSKITYLTLQRLHLMGLVDDSRCTLCSLGVPGTFLHVMWTCHLSLVCGTGISLIIFFITYFLWQFRCQWLLYSWMIFLLSRCWKLR